MKDKTEKNQYKFIDNHKDKDGITRKYKRYVITERNLLPDEIEQLEKILACFPHVSLRNWHKVFASFNPEGYRPDLLTLAANAFDSNQNNMLGIVAEYGYEVHLLEKLMDMGADLDTPDLCGRPPIYWGICNNKSFRKKESYSAVSVVQYLLNNGADKEVLYKGITPYQYAKSDGYIAAANLIQRHSGYLQSSLQSKIIQGFVGSDVAPLPKTKKEKKALKKPNLTFFNQFDASYIKKPGLTLPPLQRTLIGGFKSHLYLAPEEINGIQTINELITVQNKIVHTDNAGLISAMSKEHLQRLITKHSHLNEFLKLAYLEEETFALFLEKAGYQYLKKVIDITDIHFSWHWFLNNIPAHLINTILFRKNSFIKEITSCKHLGIILDFLNEEGQALLYEKIGSRLPQIVKNLFDLRDISPKFYPKLFQKLNHSYLADLVKKGYYLFKVLSGLPEQDKLSFLERIGFDKLRSYIHKEDYVKKLFKKMPPETHALLKKHLFLYETKVHYNGLKKKLPDSKPAKSLDLDLSKSQTDFKSISDPYTTPEGKVIGLARHKNKWVREFVVYNPVSDNMEGRLEDIRIDHFQVIDKKQQIFLVHRWETNAYYQLKWEDGKLKHQDTAYAKWNKGFDGERFNDMIPLADGTWMILSQEENNVINNYKGWSIDIYDPEACKLSRMLNVHRDQNHYVTRLTLMPDGKTVLAWDTSSVKAKAESCCSTGYNICLINTTDFSVQAITLPIDPKEFPGAVTHIEVQGDQVEIEIQYKSDSYFDTSAFKKYFSFEFKRIVDLTPKTETEDTVSLAEHSPTYFNAGMKRFNSEVDLKAVFNWETAVTQNGSVIQAKTKYNLFNKVPYAGWKAEHEYYKKNQGNVLSIEQLIYNSETQELEIISGLRASAEKLHDKLNQKFNSYQVNPFKSVISHCDKSKLSSFFEFLDNDTIANDVPYLDIYTFMKFVYLVDVSEIDNVIPKTLQNFCNGTDEHKRIQRSFLPSNICIKRYGNPEGDFYTLSETSASSAGISDFSIDQSGVMKEKQVHLFKTLQKIPILESYAKSIMDTWSIPGFDIETSGGGKQFILLIPKAELSNYIEDQTVAHVVERNNSLSPAQFDFDIAGNERCITYIEKVKFLNNNNISISLAEFDGVNPGKKYEKSTFFLPNISRYPELLWVLTGLISPEEAAKKLGITSKMRGFFAEYTDSEGKVIEQNSPLGQLNKLLLFFPRSDNSNHFQNNSLYKMTRERVIDTDIECMLQKYMYDGENYTCGDDAHDIVRASMSF